MRRIRRAIKSSKGQVSIMMAVMMTTFLFFFAFVINTGMLVNAKINLQNAADLAAYSGASVQARLLSQIGYLNYEMRRNYKKFLFRYYVMGNLAQKDFPRSGGGMDKSDMVWSPDGTMDHDFKVPVVCIQYNAQDAWCHLPELPKIIIPQETAFDAINDALIKNLKQLEKTREENCDIIGMTNKTVLNLWLWNTDPDFTFLNESSLGDMQRLKEAMAVIRGLGFGLGLVPREIILRERIRTLETYLNEKPEKDLTLERVDSMRTQQIPEPPLNERKIQAFLSAYYTLGNYTFSAGSVRMDELIPEDGTVRLKDIPVHFDAYALDYAIVDGKCVPRFIRDGVKRPIPVGVYKDPQILTYYALRLKAKARLLFSPFGEIELKAYSAAQPFGSRIGPNLPPEAWVRSGAVPSIGASAKSDPNVTNQIPNLAIRGRDVGDGAGENMGWDTREVMGGMYQTMQQPGADPRIMTITTADLNRAYHVAMSPNPAEPHFYNIPVDGDDSFVRHFDTQGIYAFWAPVFPLKKMGSMASEIESLLTSYMGASGSVEDQQFKEKAKEGLARYIERLRQGHGEVFDIMTAGGNATRLAEGFKIVRITDPSRTRPGEGEQRPVSGPYTVADPKQLKTSWNDIYNENFEKGGRTGYSVKFVSFSHLRSPVSTNGNETHKNVIPQDDPETQMDLEFLKH